MGFPKRETSGDSGCSGITKLLIWEAIFLPLAFKKAKVIETIIVL